MSRCVLIVAFLCMPVTYVVAGSNNDTIVPLPPTVYQAVMVQAEVLKLAKARAKQEKGRTFDDYHVNSVTFDPQSREWTISFTSGVHRSSHACLLVIVNDATRETKVLRC